MFQALWDSVCFWSILEGPLGLFGIFGSGYPQVPYTLGTFTRLNSIVPTESLQLQLQE